MRDGRPRPGGDRARERQLIDAFLDAARRRDFAALLGLLDPAVVLRTDRPGAPVSLCGARAVAAGARLGVGPATATRPARVNGRPRIVALDAAGRALALLGFAIAGRRIVAIDVYADPARQAQLDLRVLDA